ncbi:regulatory inactivation of DnaA Hda protein [Stakelama sediminis]|uniref:Chromosomal replication initiator DnaA n=1 Tax=Stakelama sediminis TaxID=463200 RepID=A0A840YZD6_9SPHN|nr:DnaA/Hda family protein [Stakelama sediminis]MBB5718862.1 hypothetical protein [Stakelama sediminis]
MTQLELPLGRPGGASDEFLIGAANENAARMLEHPGAWPVMAALIVGPRKSGRSLLARMTALRTGGRMIDNAEQVSETDLFHAWNQAQAEHKPLLMVADAPPPEWRVRLPDLRSRLAATPVARIDPPDDALIAALLRYWFDRREMAVDDAVIEWLSTRTERSYVALLRAVDVLDDSRQENRRRRLSIRAARSTLEETGLLFDRLPLMAGRMQ